MALLYNALCQMSTRFLVDVGQLSRDEVQPPQLMIDEIELPCSDCGAELVRRTIHTREVPVTTTWHGSVTVTECASCSARYYPDKTLSQLSNTADDSRSKGGR